MESPSYVAGVLLLFNLQCAILVSLDVKYARKRILSFIAKYS